MNRTVKIWCQICQMHYITDLPSKLNQKEMDAIEKNWVCYPCIKEGRKQRDDVDE